MRSVKLFCSFYSQEVGSLLTKVEKEEVGWHSGSSVIPLNNIDLPHGYCPFEVRSDGSHKRAKCYLIIDNDEIAAKEMREIVEKTLCETFIVKSKEEGLNMTRHGFTFDFILLDMDKIGLRKDLGLQHNFLSDGLYQVLEKPGHSLGLIVNKYIKVEDPPVYTDAGDYCLIIVICYFVVIVI
ncbi:hypothetical protein TorRG33x02_259420 [Trema orientale]|uniref:Uncharacterized protein n=1 Tax=Trema orientale TaxID=63057 RepID=A0A2P5D8D7_TREOI|nr:hypothetical protein TorRG33x02_259420 [Trema orientale]